MKVEVNQSVIEKNKKNPALMVDDQSSRSRIIAKVRSLLNILYDEQMELQRFLTKHVAVVHECTFLELFLFKFWINQSRQGKLECSLFLRANPTGRLPLYGLYTNYFIFLTTSQHRKLRRKYK